MARGSQAVCLGGRRQSLRPVRRGEDALVGAVAAPVRRHKRRLLDRTPLLGAKPLASLCRTTGMQKGSAVLDIGSRGQNLTSASGRRSQNAMVAHEAEPGWRHQGREFSDEFERF
jgi:hypothetical protein